MVLWFPLAYCDDPIVQEATVTQLRALRALPQMRHGAAVIIARASQ